MTRFTINPFTGRLDVENSGGGSGGTVSSVTGNDAVVVSSDGAGNINIVGGTGITTAGNAGTNTLTINSSGGGITWSVVTGTTQAGAVNNGYIANNAGLVTITLPSVSAVGTVIAVTGINNATGWKIAQNAGNQIFLGNLSSTSGATGFISSTLTRDTVHLVCVTANAAWNVINSMGNITVS